MDKQSVKELAREAGLRISLFRRSPKQDGTFVYVNGEPASHFIRDDDSREEVKSTFRNLSHIQNN